MIKEETRKTSKFRNVFGKGAVRKSETYEGIRVSKHQTEGCPLAVNPKWMAVSIQSEGGGTFVILPLWQKGRIDDSRLPHFAGHSKPIVELAWNPFDDDVIATGSEDATVKIWQVSTSALGGHNNNNVNYQNNLSSSNSNTNIHRSSLNYHTHSSPHGLLVSLQRHDKRVNCLAWHPAASNILATTSSDARVIIWNTETGHAFRTIVDHEDAVWDAAWNYDGSLLATTCKDKLLRILDPRKGSTAIETKSHQGVKSSRVFFVDRDPYGHKDHYLITTGFSRMSERQIAVWDQRKMKEPLSLETIDSSPGALFPFFDQDTGILYIGGKGDGSIRFYEFRASSLPPDYSTHFNIHTLSGSESDGEVDKHHLLSHLGMYQTSIPQTGLCAMPKRGLDTSICEIYRFYKLRADSTATNNITVIEPVSMIVPRKSMVYQEDLYPPTASPRPALQASEWIAGKNCNPLLVSLKNFAGVFTEEPPPKPGQRPLSQLSVLKSKFLLREGAGTNQTSTNSTNTLPPVSSSKRSSDGQLSTEKCAKPSMYAASTSNKDIASDKESSNAMEEKVVYRQSNNNATPSKASRYSTGALASHLITDTPIVKIDEMPDSQDDSNSHRTSNRGGGGKRTKIREQILKRDSKSHADRIAKAQAAFETIFERDPSPVKTSSLRRLSSSSFSDADRRAKSPSPSKSPEGLKRFQDDIQKLRHLKVDAIKRDRERRERSHSPPRSSVQLNKPFLETQKVPQSPKKWEGSQKPYFMSLRDQKIEENKKRRQSGGMPYFLSQLHGGSGVPTTKISFDAQNPRKSSSKDTVKVLNQSHKKFSDSKRSSFPPLLAPTTYSKTNDVSLQTTMNSNQLNASYTDLGSRSITGDRNVIRQPSLARAESTNLSSSTPNSNEGVSPNSSITSPLPSEKYVRGPNQIISPDTSKSNVSGGSFKSALTSFPTKESVLSEKKKEGAYLAPPLREVTPVSSGTTSPAMSEMSEQSHSEKHVDKKYSSDEDDQYLELQQHAAQWRQKRASRLNNKQQIDSTPESPTTPVATKFNENQRYKMFFDASNTENPETNRRRKISESMKALARQRSSERAPTPTLESSPIINTKNQSHSNRFSLISNAQNQQISDNPVSPSLPLHLKDLSVQDTISSNNNKGPRNSVRNITSTMLSQCCSTGITGHEEQPKVGYTPSPTFLQYGLSTQQNQQTASINTSNNENMLINSPKHYYGHSATTAFSANNDRSQYYQTGGGPFQPKAYMPGYSMPTLSKGDTAYVEETLAHCNELQEENRGYRMEISLKNRRIIELENEVAQKNRKIKELESELGIDKMYATLRSNSLSQKNPVNNNFSNMSGGDRELGNNGNLVKNLHDFYNAKDEQIMNERRRTQNNIPAYSLNTIKNASSLSGASVLKSNAAYNIDSYPFRINQMAKNTTGQNINSNISSNLPPPPNTLRKAYTQIR